MKHWSLFLLFCFNLFYAEGFSSKTLIKIPDGYTTIGNVRVGDRVMCHDAAKNYVEGVVSSIATKSTDEEKAYNGIQR